MGVLGLPDLHLLGMFYDHKCQTTNPVQRDSNTLGREQNRATVSGTMNSALV
jgi:hypothetical protein